MIVLITGVAGFIGMHVAQILLRRGDRVIGIDNLNNYYDPQLKRSRLDQLINCHNFSFIEGDIANYKIIDEIFERERPTRVVNLAAQAGVRYSLVNPHAYIQSNLVGFGNILECCRLNHVDHLVYASSSSVYGNSVKTPFSESDSVDHPVSLYAATKKSNELMAHSYSHLYHLPTTGLRYFTVYGPWGRPDMSPWLFTSSILEGQVIDVFNHGNMQRDFTYIDDIAEGTVCVLDRPPLSKLNVGKAASHYELADIPYKIYNIGNHQPIKLMNFIQAIEVALGQKAQKNFLPMQDGDVIATCANINSLKQDIGFEPKISLEEGLASWVQWYKSYISK